MKRRHRDNPFGYLLIGLFLTYGLVLWLYANGQLAAGPFVR